MTHFKRVWDKSQSNILWLILTTKTWSGEMWQVDIEFRWWTGAIFKKKNPQKHFFKGPGRGALPSSGMAGRAWEGKIWARKARTTSILCTANILWGALQLLTTLWLELHPDLWDISTEPFTVPNWRNKNNKVKLCSRDMWNTKCKVMIWEPCMKTHET